MREQRVPGPVDLSHRGVVTVSGPDRLSWLHSLTSQHVEHLGPGSSTETLVPLTAGHIEHALYAVDDGTAFWAHVEPGTAPALVEFLDSMRFLLRVEVADVSDEFAVVWEPDTEQHGSYLSRVTDRGREVFVARSELARYVGDTPSGTWAHEARRIAAHQPRLGVDTDHKTIPHEVGWIGSAVHLDKGATAVRRPSRASTISAGRRDGWSCCTSTVPPSACRRTAIRWSSMAPPWASSAPPPAITSWARSRWPW